MRKPSLWLVLFVFALSVGAAFGARNSSGTYSLPSGNPVVTGTTITSSWANNTLADISTELTNSLDRSGRGAMLAPLQLANGTNIAPSLTFSSDTGSGLYRAGSSDIRWVVGGNQVSRLQSTAVTFNEPVTAASTLTATGAFTASSTLTTSASGVTFSDATTQATSATAQTTGGSATAGTSVSVVAFYAIKNGAKVVSAFISLSISGSIAANATLATIPAGSSWARPSGYGASNGWYGAGWRTSGGTTTAIPLAIASDGTITTGVALSSGDTVFLTATFMGT